MKIRPVQLADLYVAKVPGPMMVNRHTLALPNSVADAIECAIEHVDRWADEDVTKAHFRMSYLNGLRLVRRFSDLLKEMRRLPGIFYYDKKRHWRQH